MTPLISGDAPSTASAAIPGEFIIHDDGYRGWSWSYRDVARTAQTFRSRLRATGVGKATP
ncbi:MAG TPA: hypothetical protein VN519_08115 [Bryobacteraceae bacterium]|nr:hypothetical protein [Bryobacteraceae bacterium]